MSEQALSHCVICDTPTSAMADVDFDDQIRLIPMCQPCQDLADHLSGGSGPKLSWLPRIRVSDSTLCFAWGEAEGREVSVVWGRLHIEFTIAWRQK